MDLEGPEIVQEEIKHAGTKVVPVFSDLRADDSDQAPTEIATICMRCHKEGVTKLMLTRVPFFRELVISSFQCEHCNFSGSEISSAGRIQEKGVKIVLQVSSTQDLNRQIVKSDSAVIKIPYVELEIPPKKGCFTTIEGTINTTCEELSFYQEERRLQHPETAEKIDQFISKLKSLLLVHEPFQFVLEDPTGNSHIENPKAPSPDPLLHTVHFTRTQEQDTALGISAGAADAAASEEGSKAHLSETPLPGEPGVSPINVSDEVLQFATNCSQCNTPCQTNMKTVNIPRFKQVIIMAMVCDFCGYKDNEVKSGSGIAEKGHTYTLLIKETIDLSRDVLKSDTAACTIPELDFHLVHGSLGGRFTTVEGLIANMRDQLKNTNFTFTGGDSSSKQHMNKVDSLCAELEDIIAGKTLGIHVVIDDPAGNSYVQDIYEPEPDPCLTKEEYLRTAEQDDDLGLTGMNTASTDKATT